MLKAIREAKTFTSWLEPDEEYEAAVRAYAEAVLDTTRSADLLHDVSRFVACVARPGLWNALSRTVLQLTSPGIPDIYQGDELWNFSLVDPDNRRPVAWPLRRELLESVIGQPDAADLVRSPEDGRIKLLLHRRLLCLRRERPELFTAADYTPVHADGACARHVIAYLRRAGSSAMLVAVPRLPRLLAGDPDRAPVGDVWADTRLVLPDGAGEGEWRSVLTGTAVVPGDGMPLARLLGEVPAAVLVR
jgi:(1->4)-alpha-D-glucan 1-alpha-D-glucosylmutase